MSPASTSSTKPKPADLVIVANRLPVDKVVEADGSVTWRRSPGGLVTALEPVMRSNDCAWIGWSGGSDDDIEPFVDDGLSLIPVPLSAEEVEDFYEGFSNATLWPLYHDVVAKPEFHREWWDAYVRVNRRFAEKTAEVAAEGAAVWVHDYQMQLVQRPGASQNFVRLVRQRVGHKTHRDMIYLPDGRVVQAGSYPISIDTQGLDELARTDAVEQRAKEIREQLGNPRRVLLGIDRLDYTKGIYDRLRAFGELVRDGDVTVEDVVFVQVATPSRERVGQYRRLRDEIDRLVGRLNGDLGTIGSPAIHYLHNSYPKEEMAALFRAADVMVVTPLRDGMNLVAKEYVACRYDDQGALVLSEFAGAADELRQAFMVNPYDINGMKAAIVSAMDADPRDLARRMKAMRKTVAEHDVKQWARKFLAVLADVQPAHDKQLRPSRNS